MKEMMIQDHALIYALLCKNCLNEVEKQMGEKLIEEITVSYGISRGKRMKRLALSENRKADLDSFFIHGEWKGQAGENISEMVYGKDRTASIVKKCAWFDTWEKYGLLKYGKYYCRYIDKAIAQGFEGDFSLEVKKTISAGDGSCEFVWNSSADKNHIEEEKIKKDHVLPFSFHVKELLECAREVLKRYDLENIIDKTTAEYRKLIERQQGE